jgi:hypothetical protein
VGSRVEVKLVRRVDMESENDVEGSVEGSVEGFGVSKAVDESKRESRACCEVESRDLSTIVAGVSAGVGFFFDLDGNMEFHIDSSASSLPMLVSRWFK